MIEQTETVTWAFYSGLLMVLSWIGRSLTHMVKEIKAVGLIVRSCPNCSETVDKIDKLQSHL